MISIEDLQENPPTCLPGDENGGLFDAIVDVCPASALWYFGY